jgi:hypothetical protein
MRARLIVLLLLLGPAGLSAQQQQPDLSRLRRGTDSMSIILVRNGDEVPVGQLWDEIIDTSVRGAPALRRVYRTVNAVFGPHAETTVVRTPKLNLLTRRTYAQLASDSVAVGDDSIRGWRDVGQQGRQPIARQADSTAIDGSMFDVLLRAAPLGPGYRIQARAYISTQDTIGVLTAWVTGASPIRQRDMRIVDTWVVAIDFLGLSSTLWIDKESRALVRQVITLSPEIQMLMQR